MTARVTRPRGADVAAAIAGDEAADARLAEPRGRELHVHCSSLFPAFGLAPTLDA